MTTRRGAIVIIRQCFLPLLFFTSLPMATDPKQWSELDLWVLSKSKAALADSMVWKGKSSGVCNSDLYRINEHIEHLAVVN